MADMDSQVAVQSLVDTEEDQSQRRWPRVGAPVSLYCIA